MQTNERIDPNLADANGYTALHWLGVTVATDVVRKRIDPIPIARKLLDDGARIDARTRDGETPLMIALQYARWKYAHFLLERGANPRLSDNKKRSVLTLAVQRLVYDDTPVKDPATDPNLGPILQRGAPIRLTDAILLKDRERARALARSDDVSARGQWEESVLHRAAWLGDAPLIERLLARRQKTDAKDVVGATPLHYAAGGFDDGTFQGIPRLTEVCDGGDRAEVARLLLKAGAKVDALCFDAQHRIYGGWGPRKNEQDAFDGRCTIGHRESNSVRPHKNEQDTFDGRGDGRPYQSPLYWAIKLERTELAAALLAAGADADRRILDGIFPIRELAARAKDPALRRLLQDAPARPRR